MSDINYNRVILTQKDYTNYSFHFKYKICLKIISKTFFPEGELFPLSRLVYINSQAMAIMQTPQLMLALSDFVEGTFGFSCLSSFGSAGCERRY